MRVFAMSGEFSRVPVPRGSGVVQNNSARKTSSYRTNVILVYLHCV